MHMYDNILRMFHLHVVAWMNTSTIILLSPLWTIERYRKQWVPLTLSKVSAFFLEYDGNFVFCEVTGKRLNSGVQLGVEVPCVHKYYGHQTYIDKLKELVVNVEQW